MKIAIPWPSHSVRQKRIKVALNLAEDHSMYVLCSVTDCDDSIMQEFDSVLLERDSSQIGGNPPRAFAHDMLKIIRTRYPSEKWYGLGNSDCVLVGNPTDKCTDQVLTFHRTDIINWEHRRNVIDLGLISQETMSLMEQFRQEGLNSSRIARKLNRLGVPCLPNKEWSQQVVDLMFIEQGVSYIWGRDLFLFRDDAVDEAIGWLKHRDPIIGVPGYDNDLFEWCKQRFETKSLYHNLFHKVHPPEWTSNDASYRHNGASPIRKSSQSPSGRLFKTSFPYMVEDSMSFITNEKLCQATHFLSSIIPPNIEGIIGIARSGMIPASLLSCHLHLPLYTVSKESGVMNCGHGVRFGDKKSVNKFLLVDDTVFLGRTLDKVLPIVKSDLPDAQILTAAIYVTPMAKNLVDYFACELPDPHFLEWNLFNAYPGESCAFDMDGVLCEEIPPEDDDDGERYLNALKTVRPKYLPRRHWAQMIITARLERYRDVTLEWLNRHGINVNKLIMGPWDTLEERNRPNEVAKFKSEHYKNSPLLLMVESCPMQSKFIAETTNKRVLCPSARRVFQ